jgi:DNA-binding LytR/AlgR family response regulator
MEEILIEFSVFKRVHHSYIVNLNEIAKYVRGEGGYLVMSDGATISVSRSRKEAYCACWNGIKSNYPLKLTNYTLNSGTC